MDVFADDEPDLMGLQLVREFDDLTKKFYGIFNNDLDEWAEYSEIYVGIGSVILEMDIVSESSRPNKNAKGRKFKRKFETV
jgi:hypothetical protein